MTGGIGAMRSTRCSCLASTDLPPGVQLKRMQRIIQEELTQLQREAIVGVYFQGKTLTQIAEERNVNKSTIYRTLKRGEDKLRRFLQY